MRGRDLTLLRYLQAAAYLVIIAWGIRAAAEILSIVLISLLLSYAMLPFPKWLMHRFSLRKGPAIVWTVGFVTLLYLVVYTAMFEAGFHMRAKMPIYHEHFLSMYQAATAFLNAHGLQSVSVPTKSLYSSDQVIGYVEYLAPKVLGFVSDRILIAILSLIFLVEIVEAEGSIRGSLAGNLLYYGKDVQRFIAISAQTGAITAVANLAILLALRVDFPVIWCVLYFFLHFIPNIGFLISIIPPAALALLMFGWQKALFVVAGFLVTQAIADNVLQPLLMKKSLQVTFLQSMLSLMIWGFLLGLAGAILAIPLTIALKKFLDNPLRENKLAAAG